MRVIGKTSLLKAVKAAVGASLAIWLAMALGLQYASSAGIITLLSLQDTKKETLLTAFQRLLSFLAALLLAFASFQTMGYTLWAFGVYLIGFVFVCHFFSFHNAIALCSVLIAHFWTEQSMALPLVWNEFLLLVIGAGIGILFHLFLPGNLPMIRERQRQIECVMRGTLRQMADALEGKQQKELQTLQHLEDLLAAARKEAKAAMNNTLTTDLGYYVEYMDMRKNQSEVLGQMQFLLYRLDFIPEQTAPIALLLRGIADSFHEYNNAAELLKDTQRIHQYFKEDALPQTRQEFEARAVLFQLLNDIRYFLLLKNTFAQSITDEQKKRFWSDPPQEAI